MKSTVFSSYSMLELEPMPLQNEHFLKDDSLALKPLTQLSLMFFHYVPYIKSFVVVDFSMVLCYINKETKRACARINIRVKSNTQVFGQYLSATNGLRNYTLRSCFLQLRQVHDLVCLLCKWFMEY